MNDGSSLRLASAGVAVVGTSFGMARYGFGLLLPDIRAAYGLSSGELGLIGAGSYVAYLAATAAAAVIAKAGARFVVLLGGAFATTGMVLACRARDRGSWRVCSSPARAPVSSSRRSRTSWPGAWTRAGAGA